MRIAIVGGGCSGLLVAVNLLRNEFRGPLVVVEPRAELGRVVDLPFNLPVSCTQTIQMAGDPDRVNLAVAHQRRRLRTIAVPTTNGMRVEIHIVPLLP